MLENGSIVLIQRPRALIPIIGGSPERKELGTQALKAINVDRTVERVRVLANSNRFVLVESYQSVPRLLEPLSELSRRK